MRKNPHCRHRPRQRQRMALQTVQPVAREFLRGFLQLLRCLARKGLRVEPRLDIDERCREARPCRVRIAFCGDEISLVIDDRTEISGALYSGLSPIRVILLIRVIAMRTSSAAMASDTPTTIMVAHVSPSGRRRISRSPRTIAIIAGLRQQQRHYPQNDGGLRLADPAQKLGAVEADLRPHEAFGIVDQARKQGRNAVAVVIRRSVGHFPPGCFDRSPDYIRLRRGRRHPGRT